MKQEDSKEILQQYGVGPIQFSGTNDALYERHLTFDHVVDVKKANSGSSLKQRHIRSAISFHNAGSGPRTPMSRRIPSGCITCRWNFSSEGHSPIT